MKEKIKIFKRLQDIILKIGQFLKLCLTEVFKDFIKNYIKLFFNL
ncbi:hypothetical protein [Clostridium tetani]|nr:hypothetical protein [Clostridium tetani]